jgi:hypothetical protein
MKTAILILCTGLIASACSISAEYHGIRVGTTEHKKEISIKN